MLFIRKQLWHLGNKSLKRDSCLPQKKALLVSKDVLCNVNGCGQWQIISTCFAKQLHSTLLNVTFDKYCNTFGTQRSKWTLPWCQKSLVKPSSQIAVPATLENSWVGNGTNHPSIAPFTLALWTAVSNRFRAAVWTPLMRFGNHFM